MCTAADILTNLPDRPLATDRFELPPDIPISLIGTNAAWFTVARDADAIMIRPTEPLPCRCLIRPAALFQQNRGFPDVNTVMGRLLFLPGATEPQRYLPFTRDSHRQFRELFLSVEGTPDDDLFASATRWKNDEAIARRLLAAAGVPWEGLPEVDVEQLVAFEPWQQPLEGCVLNALAQWTATRGRYVIEIGSLRGLSATMLARALRDAKSTAMLISVDPHFEQPHNHSQVRLALSQIGEENRLVQVPCGSDEAWRLLRPGTASLIFVDGDHSCRQVVADFNNYRELLAPGGCMVFHDYGYGQHNGRPDVVPGVRPAVDEYIMSAEEFRPLLLAHTLFAFVKQGVSRSAKGG